MQTMNHVSRRNSSRRNSSREHTSPKVVRPQRKVSESVQVAGLITSSARKQKSVNTLLKKNEDQTGSMNSDTRFNMLQGEISPVCLGSDAADSKLLQFKDYNKGSNQHALETIFSCTFRVSKGVGGENQLSEHTTASMNAMNHRSMDLDTTTGSKTSDEQSLDSQVLPSNTDAANSPCDLDLGADLPSEVSAIYLSMKNSKLECVDENDHECILTSVCVEGDESEEFDQFDPYVFIKNLPALSTVVPTFRPILLPKQTRSCPPISLVLDLDETLVHSTLEPCDDADFTFPVNFNLMQHTVYVKCRPHLKDFMERVASLFEIIIFTASQSIYADHLLNVLDPKRKIFRHRVFRDSCVFVEGNYLKDLSVLGRDLAHIVIIDNSPQAFGFQVENGIPIESWFSDRSDQELLVLLPFLESLVGAEDVRPLIAEKFNLREKVAAAIYPLEN